MSSKTPLQSGSEGNEPIPTASTISLLFSHTRSRRHEQQKQEYAACCFLLVNLSVLILLIPTATVHFTWFPYLSFFYQLTSSLSLISPHSIFQSINQNSLYLADYILGSTSSRHLVLILTSYLYLSPLLPLLLSSSPLIVCAHPSFPSGLLPALLICFMHLSFVERHQALQHPSSSSTSILPPH
ncbi:hypothetical protein L873DRAFT_42847 [Choiromyces venosus 120613-1]|uniref:Uncharacterized protein n=1 Tax=Choiromyces venosus 120613-1 TaxID=1336337 RepID=A0A3N4K6E8_9PEZI|nr:hypothetical protein L873DRAFT_42847 [Choiromyces venosus 120613-1]